MITTNRDYTVVGDDIATDENSMPVYQPKEVTAPPAKETEEKDEGNEA